MELRHIKAGGKDRPFLFSYSAIRELANTDLTGQDEIEVMAFLGFKFGEIKEAKIESRKPVVDFSQSDIPDWFEDDFQSFLEVQSALEQMKALQEKMMAPQNRQQRRSQKKS